MVLFAWNFQNMLAKSSFILILLSFASIAASTDYFPDCTKDPSKYDGLSGYQEGDGQFLGFGCVRKFSAVKACW